MQTTLPLAYFSDDVIEQIPIALWSELFDAIGWPSTLKRHGFSHGEVLEALAAQQPSDDLILAIEAIHELGTEAGRDAIIQIMEERMISDANLSKDLSGREFAAHLYLLQRKSPALAEVFSRAQIKIEEEEKRPTYSEFMGKCSRPIRQGKKACSQLESRLREYCIAKELGEHAQVLLIEDDGIYIFRLIHSYRTKKPLAAMEQGQGRATIKYRPVYADLVRYDAATGRLRIAARVPALVMFYRELFGEVLFEDKEFFAGDAICNLKRLQKDGERVLSSHSMSSVGRAWLAECAWERGDRTLHRLRSDDCFREIRENNLPFEEGDLIEVKLKLQIVGKSTRPVTVTIRAPNRIKVPHRRYESIIYQYLDAIGIRGKHRPSQDQDLWALRPWRHSKDVWKVLFADRFEDLVRREILKPIVLDSIEHPEFPGAGRVLVVKALPSGDFLGDSKMEEIPSINLSPTDVEGWEMDVEALQGYLRDALGLKGNADHRHGDALLNLGVLEIGSFKSHLVYVLGDPGKDIGHLVQNIAPSGTPVTLLVPQGRVTHLTDRDLMLEGPIPTRQWLERAMSHKYQLNNQVEAIHLAPLDARLVVDTQRGLIWVDRIPITGIGPDTQSFKFVEALAKAGGEAISTKSLAGKISPGRFETDSDPTQAARKAKRDVRTAIEKALGHKLSDDPFPSPGKGSYRCALPPFVQ